MDLSKVCFCLRHAACLQKELEAGFQPAGLRLRTQFSVEPGLHNFWYRMWFNALGIRAVDTPCVEQPCHGFTQRGGERVLAPTQHETSSA